MYAFYVDKSEEQTDICLNFAFCSEFWSSAPFAPNKQTDPEFAGMSAWSSKQKALQNWDRTLQKVGQTLQLRFQILSSFQN